VSIPIENTGSDAEDGDIEIGATGNLSQTGPTLPSCFIDLFGTQREGGPSSDEREWSDSRLKFKFMGNLLD